MNELLKTILSLSLSGTILILLLFLLRPLYQNRLSKRWQYYIWLIAILRLLLPVSPQTSVIGTLFGQIEQRLEQYTTAPAVTAVEDNQSSGSLQAGHESATGPARIDISEGTDGATDADYHASSTGADTDNDLPSAVTDAERDTPSAKIYPEEISATRIPESLPFTLGIVWLVIALLLFVRKITIYQSFVKYINAGSAPVEDINLLERFGKILDEHHIHGTIDLRVNSLAASPLLIGFIHARIILPTAELSDDDFYYTALHELTHYKRKDMFYKWLVQLTICLHWFNPFVYLMGRETNRLCELSCDERVIMTFPENLRKLYGDTLLHAIDGGGSYKDALASVTLNESKELLKGRLDAIMKYHKIPKIIQSAGIFITGMLIGGAVVLGAYAAPGHGNTDSPDTAATDITSPDTAASVGESSDDATAFPNDETFERKEDFAGAEHSTANHTYLPHYSIQYEDGIYYIMVEGATKDDKPITGVTPGYKQLVLVCKDYYATFGTFGDRDMTSLARYITEQCNTMLDNDEISQENANIVIQAAEEIQSTYNEQEEEGVVFYNYRQSVYYQCPYMIYVGYNLTPEAQSSYICTLRTLSDQSTMYVWFNGESKKFLFDKDALTAVTALVERIKSEKAGSTPAFESPLITHIEYVGAADTNLAQKYYKEDNLAYFNAIFPELDRRTKLEYLDRMFEDDNISFFAACIGMPEDGELQTELVERYIHRAYEENDISFFALLSGMLEESSLEKWREKCNEDGRDDFTYVLADSEYPDYEELFDGVLSNEDYFDEDSLDDWSDIMNEWSDIADEWSEAKSQQQKEDTNTLGLNRLTKKEVSDSLRSFLDSLDDRNWYLIDGGDGQQYIYYNGLPHTYAYEPNIIQNDGAEDRIIIDIVNFDFFNTPHDRDTEETLGNYVLLTFSYAPKKPDTGYSLEITYNGLPITYEIVQGK